MGLVPKKLIIGVDSGATKTVCAIANHRGKVLGLGYAGASSHYAVSVKTAKENFSAAVREAVTSAELTDVVFDVGCFGMTALDSRPDYELVSKFIRSMNICKKCLIVSDAEVAYYAVTRGEPGIVVIAGTGSIAYGVNRRGEAARSGGWEWLISDEGSAFDIARRGVVAAIRAYDGRGRNTVLADLFKKHFDIATLEDIVEKVYTDSKKSTVASLAPIVTAAAQNGDVVASGILEQAGRELGLAAAAVAKKLRMEKEATIVGCVGGVFRSGTYVFRPFATTVRNHIPNAILKPPIYEASIGAIILGLKESGVPITSKLVSRVEHDLKLRKS